MTTVLRADRVVFRFSGADAHRLINDVVTGVIPHHDSDTTSLWALLSPQGKILAEGLAAHADGALWLDVHQSVADDFFKRMRMYKLRANVEIADLRDTHRVGYSPDAVPKAQKNRLGPVALGWQIIASIADTDDWSTDDTPYHAARIVSGILHQGNDFAANDVFAHDIGMDILEGIDFVKGCYVGQEVVSRMKHRGTARRRPVIVSSITAPSGSAVVAGSREAGTLGQVVNGKAVAILRLDRITDPNAVTVDGKPVTLTLPAWANYIFGESPPED
jgi:folate-binding protein YgfZ